MKKYIYITILFIIISSFCLLYLKLNENDDDKIVKKTENKEIREEVKEKNIYPSYNGYLKVSNTKLLNQNNEEFILKGVSSHGIQWFYDLYTKENLKSLKDDFNINVFRIAMYTKEGGYIDDPSIKEKVIKIVDDLIDLDMYVIIDWHILSDNNPLMFKEDSIKFFGEISKKYKNVPNVIYEICNEPNGNTTFSDISSYANEVIKVIRKESPKSIVIVGTPTWCQDVDKVFKLEFENILYALHFYSGTHKEDLRERVKTALNNNIPIIVSEFGVSDASGSGGIYLEETDKWIEFLKSNNISLISWSLSNKNETSAILKENTNTVSDENLTETGIYLKNMFKEY